MKFAIAIIAAGLLAAGCGGSSGVARKLPQRLAELRGRAMAERIAKASPRPASVLVIQIPDPASEATTEAEWRGFVAGWGSESGLQRMTIDSQDPEFAADADFGLSLQHLKQKADAEKPASICSFARLRDEIAVAPSSMLPPLFYAIPESANGSWAKMAGRSAVKAVLIARDDANLVGMSADQATFESIFRILP